MQEPHWNVFNYLALTWNQRINRCKKAICKVFLIDLMDYILIHSKSHSTTSPKTEIPKLKTNVYFRGHKYTQDTLSDWHPERPL